MEFKVTPVDLLEFLLTNPGAFREMDDVQKRELVSKRPTPVLDSFLLSNDGSKRLEFKPEWYTSYEWLTGSLQRGKLYCFPCLVLGDLKGSSEIFHNIRNFDKKARAHEISKNHIHNYEEFLRISKAGQPSTESSTEALTNDAAIVKIKRNIIKKLIQTLVIFVKNRNPHLNLTNSDWFGETINFLASNDIHFSCDWEKYFNNITSSISQMQIFNALKSITIEHMKGEIRKCEFISVQIDDMSDYCANPMYSIIFRYFSNGKIIERFAGFYDITDNEMKRNPCDSFIQVLMKWGALEKLICVSNDSALTRIVWPPNIGSNVRIMSLHSINHNLNFILIKSVLFEAEVRNFAEYITAITSFFTNPKRELRLEAEGHPVPNEFKEEGASLETYIWIIKTRFAQLERAIKYILQTKNWDLETTCLSKFIYEIFQNDQFILLLCVFSKTFIIGDQMSCGLRRLSLKNLCKDEIRKHISAIRSIQQPESLMKINEECTELLPTFKCQFDIVKFTANIANCMHRELKIRFHDQPRLAVFQLIDEKQYPCYSMMFPHGLFNSLTEEFKLFDNKKLHNELSLIYQDVSKHIPPKDLLTYFLENGVHRLYDQTIKLILLFNTLPVCFAEENEEKRIYERTKKFVRMYDSRETLHTLDIVCIEDTYIQKLLSHDKFMDKVIDLYARNNGRLDLFYSDTVG